ncbi:MAG: molybdenum cofactor guanylyltransferase MobA [Acidovorax sp.]|jgi:molybdopterin-guanine dinucleotide biosynthesis protein A|nr:molybdenum cofactor guanylyltransferase MobA [Acidovorax sp.]
MIASSDITGLVLAGGRGSRMGGVDKGLQPFSGLPLARHALQRLAPQVGGLLLNANRHLDTYRSWGVPVVADTEADYPGPLAGFLAGLLHCPTPWLLAVPCDTPRFPADLAVRMAAAAHAAGAPLAVALAPDSEASDASQLEVQVQVRAQPAFCLIHRSLLPSLQRFVSEGGRKIDRWTALHPLAQARFDQAGDDPLAFANANTLAELQALQALSPLPTDPENG